jgi:hypothetical protein
MKRPIFRPALGLPALQVDLTIKFAGGEKPLPKLDHWQFE